MSEPRTSAPAFRVETSDKTATLTFCRPDQRNSLGWHDWRDFGGAVAQLDASGGVRVLILAAEGQHFSAGMDYDFFQCSAPPKPMDHGRYREGLLNAIRHLQAAVNILEQVRFPVIAAVQGGCIGGALDMVCAATLRLCSADAYFQAAEVRVGLAPDMGTMQRLPKLISSSVATELLLTGRAMQSAEAERHGLVCGVEPDQVKLMERANTLAATIAGLSPLAVSGVKAGLLFARDNPTTAGLQHVAAWNAGLFVTEDITRSVEAQRRKVPAAYDDLRPKIPDWLFPDRKSA